MAHPNEDQLLASLPKAALAAMKAVLANAPPTVAEGLADQGQKYAKPGDALEKVFEAIDFDATKLPLAKDLTKPQRAVAEIIAYRDAFSVYLPGFPHLGYWRRRWLGLETPGALERETNGVPLWKKIANEDEYSDDMLLEMKLPLRDRLQIWWDIACGAYRLDFDAGDIEWGKLAELTSKQPEITNWAVACLKQVATAKLEGGVCRAQRDTDKKWAWPIFKAISLAKIPIDSTWDAFLPQPPGRSETAADSIAKCALYRQWVGSLPEERRAKAIIASLGPFETRRVNLGIQWLDEFPSRELTEHVLEVAPRSDFSASEVKKMLGEVGKKHPLVAEVFLEKAKNAPKPVKLTVTRTIEPKKLDDLTALEQKQVAVAGQAYDGKKLSAAIRMSREKKDGEHTFLGFFEIRDIADAKGTPLYTAFLYRVDSGSIFKAGTTTEVASIAQSGVECEDAALRSALIDVTENKKKKPATKKKAVAKAPTAKKKKKKPKRNT